MLDAGKYSHYPRKFGIKETQIFVKVHSKNYYNTNHTYQFSKLKLIEYQYSNV